jgi:hypothetical protein
MLCCGNEYSVLLIVTTKAKYYESYKKQYAFYCLFVFYLVNDA